MLILRDRLRHVEASGQRDRQTDGQMEGRRAGLGRTAPGAPSTHCAPALGVLEISPNQTLKTNTKKKIASRGHFYVSFPVDGGKYFSAFFLL